MTEQDFPIIVQVTPQQYEGLQAGKYDAMKARIAELEAALREYEDAFCEGLCAEMPNIADHDCSGCRARAALGKDKG